MDSGRGFLQRFEQAVGGFVREQIGFVKDEYLAFTLKGGQMRCHLHVPDLIDADTLGFRGNQIHYLNVSMLAGCNPAAGGALLAGDNLGLTVDCLGEVDCQSELSHVRRPYEKIGMGELSSLDTLFQ
jgi:hypothetical protein